MNSASLVASCLAVVWFVASGHAQPAPRAAAEAEAAPMALAAKLAAEERIVAALDEVTRFDFVEMPLSDAVMFLADVHKIQIVIDGKALDDAGLGADVPVTKSLKDISLRSALRLMLRDLELTYIVENEVLQITTPEAADEAEAAEEAKAAPMAAPAADERTAEELIEAALAEKTRLDFLEMPLVDVVTYLEDVHKIQIDFDKKALDEAGLGSDIPVSKQLVGITLASALNLMLNDLELTYIIDNEVLLITTYARGAARLCVKLYPVRNLIDAGWEMASLLKVVKSHTGVEGEILGGYLAVTQSQPAHRRTAKLMDELAGAAQNDR